HGARIRQQALEVRTIETVATKRWWNQLHQVHMAVAGGKLRQAEPVTMWPQAHRLGIDRDDRAEHQILRQVVSVQMDGAARHELGGGHALPIAENGVGAQEKTRTSTTLRPQVPETC